MFWRICFLGERKCNNMNIVIIQNKKITIQNKNDSQQRSYIAIDSATDTGVSVEIRFVNDIYDIIY